MNESLRMIDLKAVTEDFYQRVVESVNDGKRADPIDFKRDEKFLRRAHASNQSDRALSAEKHTKPMFDEQV
jgi:hypothetical protein